MSIEKKRASGFPWRISEISSLNQPFEPNICIFGAIIKSVTAFILSLKPIKTNFGSDLVFRKEVFMATVNKDARTGRFVSNADVKRRPPTTYKQTVKKGK